MKVTDGHFYSAVHRKVVIPCWRAALKWSYSTKYIDLVCDALFFFMQLVANRLPVWRNAGLKDQSGPGEVVYCTVQ